jgi:NAD(P)-dependent dehydrogenase (short-subunit alcohol dehydrogenase family)
MTLQGKRIAITGAFGILGLAATRAAVAAGARVAAIDRAEPPAAPDPPEDVFQLGGTDLTSAEAAERAFGAAAERFGGLDGLVNIAGGFRWEPVAGGSIDTWDALYRLNLRTAVVACQAALPHLMKQDGSRIVNVSANAVARAAAGMGAYTASKAGVAKLTEALADELKDKGVTVNAVLPSIIDTPANRKDMPDADFSRWVSPAALAGVIVFLLSPQSAPITRALIPVAGRV